VREHPRITHHQELSMKCVPALVLLLALGTAHAAAADDGRIANYFVCTLKDGKTTADLVAFKASYERAVEDAGLDGYELRLQFPMYWGEYADGKFVWDGSWKDFAAMQRISTWFRASEWPAKFDALMSCEDSSLWRIVD
jgi:hypothetical protein